MSTSVSGASPLRKRYYALVLSLVSGSLFSLIALGVLRARDLPLLATTTVPVLLVCYAGGALFAWLMWHAVVMRAESYREMNARARSHASASEVAPAAVKVQLVRLNYLESVEASGQMLWGTFLGPTGGIVLVLIVAALLGAFAGGPAVLDPSYYFGNYLRIGAALVWIFAVGCIVQLALALLIQKRQGQTAQTLLISEKRLLAKRDEAQAAVFDWSDIDRVKERSRAIYFTGRALLWIVVPKRSFGSQGELVRLRELLQNVNRSPE